MVPSMYEITYLPVHISRSLWTSQTLQNRLVWRPKCDVWIKTLLGFYPNISSCVPWKERLTSLSTSEGEGSMASVQPALE